MSKFKALFLAAVVLIMGLAAERYFLFDAKRDMLDDIAKIRTAEECAEHHGKVKKVCMMRVEMCVVPFDDAGKPCRGSLDCIGFCRIKGMGGGIGERAVGACSADNNPCGCWRRVEGGRIQSEVCAD